MENIFKKFFGKCWIIYRRPEMARLILEQICEDTRTYMRRVVSSECALIDLESRPTGIRRTQSLPTIQNQNQFLSGHGNFKTKQVTQVLYEFQNKISRYPPSHKFISKYILPDMREIQVQNRRPMNPGDLPRDPWTSHCETSWLLVTFSILDGNSWKSLMRGSAPAPRPPPKQALFPYSNLLGAIVITRPIQVSPSRDQIHKPPGQLFSQMNYEKIKRGQITPKNLGKKLVGNRYPPWAFSPS